MVGRGGGFDGSTLSAVPVSSEDSCLFPLCPKIQMKKRHWLLTAHDRSIKWVDIQGVKLTLLTILTRCWHHLLAIVARDMAYYSKILEHFMWSDISWDCGDEHFQISATIFLTELSSVCFNIFVFIPSYLPRRISYCVTMTAVPPNQTRTTSADVKTILPKTFSQQVKTYVFIWKYLEFWVLGPSVTIYQRLDNLVCKMWWKRKN